MKKIISIILVITMALGLASCTDADENNERDNSMDLAALFTVSKEQDPEDSAVEASSTPDNNSETAAATSITTVTEPETTTEQTTTAAPETTTTTTTTTTTVTTTEPPQLLPVVVGGGSIMNDSVIFNVTGDPNTGVITFDIENNSGGAVFLFGVPTLVVDGYSVQLDPFANLTVTSKEVPANAKGIIELYAEPGQIRSGMRITGEFFSKDLGNFSNKVFDVTLI